MLNILEGYDIAKLGFGSAATIHYLAEVLKIAFADRAAASGETLARRISRCTRLRFTVHLRRRSSAVILRLP